MVFFVQTCLAVSLCYLVQRSEASLPGRGRNGREIGLSVVDKGLWVPLSEGEACVLQVVMSAKRLEEGLGLPPGQLPQSLVNGKELVLMLVSSVMLCNLY